MSLKEIVAGINELDRELCIYLTDLSNPASNAVLLDPEEDDSILRVVDGMEYHYLLEISLALKVIKDFNVTMGRKPSLEEAVQWIYEYAMNDA